MIYSSFNTYINSQQDYALQCFGYKFTEMNMEGLDFEQLQVLVWYDMHTLIISLHSFSCDFVLWCYHSFKKKDKTTCILNIESAQLSPFWCGMVQDKKGMRMSPVQWLLLNSNVLVCIKRWKLCNLTIKNVGPEL